MFTEVNQQLHTIITCFGPHSKLVKNIIAHRQNGKPLDIIENILTNEDKIKLQNYIQSPLYITVDNLCTTESIEAVSIFDENYPTLLKEISDPPLLLYYKGVLPSKGKHLAVVGTRKISSYGKNITPLILGSFIQSGGIVVSGLALGIDAAAHTASVNAGSPTIAVLGNGVDTQSIYPQINTSLATQILTNGGCLLSEYPPGTGPRKHHFIARNRIVAGLSHATLVIECAKKSGALITADYALHFNRDVFAIPGAIWSENSKGTHELIRQGARLITEPEDILEGLGINLLKTENKSSINHPLLTHLTAEPKTLDELIVLNGNNRNTTISTLTELELLGAIKNIGNQTFILQ